MQVSILANNYLRSITCKKEFDFKREKVWEVISKESNLELFHPFCKKNPVTVWDVDSHQDEIHYINGFILKRKFIAWEKNIGYDLVIGNKKHKQSFVSWRITDREKQNGSSLSISIYPYIYNMGFKFYDRIPFELYIRPQLSSYLNSVVGGLKWHIENNKPTPKNHFGPHKWFS
jgi:hypothetical protein|tara:strand:+ start:388 stop:909 length:522 start_codon:yes stop_codon:yes gene_type:complete